MIDTGTDYCALDLAGEGPRTLGEIAGLLRMTGERARQVEAETLWKLREALAAEGITAEDLTPPPGPQGEERWPAEPSGVVSFPKELRLEMLRRGWWRVRARGVAKRPVDRPWSGHSDHRRTAAAF